MRTISILVIILALVSCGQGFHDSISGNGKVKTIEISRDTINRIEVSHNVNVTCIPSDSVMVLVSADENLLDIIECEIWGGTLDISTTKYIRMAKSKEVIVYSPDIRRLEASSGSVINVRDSLHSEDLTVYVSSNADVHFAGTTESLDINASSGGSVHAAGTTDHLMVNASSASDIFAFDLRAMKCDVIASSAADVRVTIEESARFEASSAADIRYRGDPHILNSSETSMGDIRKVSF